MSATKALTASGSVRGLFRVDTCANPNCEAKFKRLGEGKIWVFDIDKPKLWGLPANTKQKSVWLCGQCSSLFSVRADHNRHTIMLARKARGAAA